MSLVPPKELENILGDISGSSALDGPATQEIGRLVTEGFRSWSSFDDEYRKQAEEIKAVSPGEARWADVGAFLVKYGGADNGAEASFNSFTFQDSEIVAVDEKVSTIAFNKRNYACGDTGGLIAVDADGKPTATLGLSLDEVQSVLRSCFDPDRATGVAYVKRPTGATYLGDAKDAVTLMVFIRQTLQQERGIWKEKSISLHIFPESRDSDHFELSGKQRAELVRALQTMPRVKDPLEIVTRQDLIEMERSLIQVLRRPPEADIAAGIRYAVWPLAALVLTA